MLEKVKKTIDEYKQKVILRPKYVKKSHGSAKR